MKPLLDPLLKSLLYSHKAGVLVSANPVSGSDFLAVV